MSWADFYLICFFVGLAFSVVSLFLGSWHSPHVHVHLNGHHGPHLGGHHPGGNGAHAGHGQPSVFNFGTIAAFLAWFGGTGYLLVRFFNFWITVALALAIVAGLAGASIVFLFLAKVLIRHDSPLDPADYEMVGVLGKVSSVIRPTGTGEMIFSQTGSRRAAPARSEGGMEILKGTEVVVTRYEAGIAYVRPWEELSNQTAKAKESL